MAYPKDDESRPHVCQICSKAFKRNEHLTRHLNTHTGLKPYECTYPECGKKFSRSDELKRHQKVHSNTLPRAKRGRKKKSEISANESNKSETNASGTSSVNANPDLPHNNTSTFHNNQSNHSSGHSSNVNIYKHINNSQSSSSNTNSGNTTSEESNASLMSVGYSNNNNNNNININSFNTGTGYYNNGMNNYNNHAIFTQNNVSVPHHNSLPGLSVALGGSNSNNTGYNTMSTGHIHNMMSTGPSTYGNNNSTAHTKSPVSFQLGDDREDAQSGDNHLSNNIADTNSYNSNSNNSYNNNNLNVGQPFVRQSRSHGNSIGSVNHMEHMAYSNRNNNVSNNSQPTSPGHALKLNALSTLKLMTPLNQPAKQSPNMGSNSYTSTNNSSTSISNNFNPLSRTGSNNSLNNMIYPSNTEFTTFSRASSTNSLSNLASRSGSLTNLSVLNSNNNSNNNNNNNPNNSGKYLDTGNYKIHKSSNSVTSLTSLSNGFVGSTSRKSLPTTPKRRNSNAFLENLAMTSTTNNTSGTKNDGFENTLTNKLQDLINTRSESPMPLKTTASTVSYAPATNQDQHLVASGTQTPLLVYVPTPTNATTTKSSLTPSTTFASPVYPQTNATSSSSMSITPNNMGNNTGNANINMESAATNQNTSGNNQNRQDANGTESTLPPIRTLNIDFPTDGLQ
ncbi:hypothetical protein ACO0RG_002356 [Hanseniaspora osmophila]